MTTSLTPLPAASKAIPALLRGRLSTCHRLAGHLTGCGISSVPLVIYRRRADSRLELLLPLAGALAAPAYPLRPHFWLRRPPPPGGRSPTYAHCALHLCATERGRPASINCTAVAR